MKPTSARERLDSALARIDDPKGEGARACLTVYREQARAAADAADARAKAGVSLGPLDGTIVSIKDLFDVAGEVTRVGSKVLAEEGKPAAADAPVVQASSRGRRGHCGQDQHERICVHGYRRKSAFWNAWQSGRSQRAFLAGRRQARRSPPPTACARSRSAPTPAAHAVFPARCAGSSATSRAVNAFRRPVRSHCRTASTRSVRLHAPLRLAPVPIRSWQTKLTCRSNRRHLPGFDIGVVQGYPLENLDETVGKRFPEAIAKLSGLAHASSEETLSLLDDMAQVNSKGGVQPAEAFAVHRDLLSRRADAIDPNVRVRLERARNISAADYIDMVRGRARLIRLMDDGLRTLMFWLGQRHRSSRRPCKRLRRQTILRARTPCFCATP